MGSLGEVYLCRISAERFMVILSTAKVKFVKSLPELHEIQKIGTATSKVLSKVTAPKILEYTYVLKTN